MVCFDNEVLTKNFFICRVSQALSNALLIYGISQLCCIRTLLILVPDALHFVTMAMEILVVLRSVSLLWPPSMY